MLTYILLQAADGSNISSIILFVGIGVVFYFFMIRPQQKKQKEQKKFVENIAKGDQVITLGGIHGKVLSVDDQVIVLEVDKGVKMKINKSSVSMESSKGVSDKKD